MTKCQKQCCIRKLKHVLNKKIAHLYFDDTLVEFQCPDIAVKCASGDECTPWYELCDGESHEIEGCKDGSDEDVNLCRGTFYLNQT